LKHIKRSNLNKRVREKAWVQGFPSGGKEGGGAKGSPLIPDARRGGNGRVGAHEHYFQAPAKEGRKKETSTFELERERVV